MTKNINYRIKEEIDSYFGSIGSPQISSDSLRVAGEMGLETCLFEKMYIKYGETSIMPKGIIKDFSKMKTDGILKGIFLFGSLKKGHYIDDLTGYERIKKHLTAGRQKLMYYSFLGDMFNYPQGSDIDFCFIVDDNYFNLNDEKIKSEFSAILLNHPKYYFEHFSIIPKNQLLELMESFYSFKIKKIDKENFSLKFFKIEPDYCPKEITEQANLELIEKRKQNSEKTALLKQNLETLKEEFAGDAVKSKMIEYSLNRINQGVTTEDKFGHQRVLKSLFRSYFLNFDPSFSCAIDNINNFSIISNSFEKFFLNFEKELKVQELENNVRMNKWHFMKEGRLEYLSNFNLKNKIKEE